MVRFLAYPGWHTLHCDNPSTSANFPSSHTVHCEQPVTLHAVPDLHFEQVSVPEECENVPAGHIVHIVASCFEKYPGIQALQEFGCPFWEKKPGLHTSHLEPIIMLPAPHIMQALEEFCRHLL
jgi:hypothetical protein